MTRILALGEQVESRFGKRLRDVREAEGISQETLAANAGLHRTYVGLIERGERNVTLRTIERLATALDVEMSELMPSRDQKKRSSGE